VRVDWTLVRLAVEVRDRNGSGEALGGWAASYCRSCLHSDGHNDLDSEGSHTARWFDVVE
jgi:hypothetical protein